jgi:hypothetical protein
MTYREIVESWEKIFILVLEDTNDSAYNKVEQIINRPESRALINSCIEDEPPFPAMIGLHIMLILCESQGIDKICEMDLDETATRLNDFWTRYLKKPTRAFTSKNGLSPVNEDDLSVSFKVIKKKKI